MISLLDKKWIEEYYWNGGKVVHLPPDYVLPDGTVDENLKKLG
jgi:hypothetical protein